MSVISCGWGFETSSFENFRLTLSRYSQGRSLWPSMSGTLLWSFEAGSWASAAQPAAAIESRTIQCFTFPPTSGSRPVLLVQAPVLVLETGELSLDEEELDLGLDL